MVPLGPIRVVTYFVQCDNQWALPKVLTTRNCITDLFGFVVAVNLVTQQQAFSKQVAATELSYAISSGHSPHHGFLIKMVEAVALADQKVRRVVAYKYRH